MADVWVKFELPEELDAKTANEWLHAVREALSDHPAVRHIQFCPPEEVWQ